jgi:peptide/nickel transport system ATP-binding protein
MTTNLPLLEVKDLIVHHRSRGRAIEAVDRVSFSVHRGETVGLIGESGSGKSSLARAILGLLAPVSGQICFDGVDVTHRRRSSWTSPPPTVRRRLQMVFQDPLNALNPRSTVGRIIEEPMRVHGIKPARERRRKVTDLLSKVGLPGSARCLYPHQFSGGQRQRINIARALALTPELIVCDEPVSALDLSIQAQVLNLLADLQVEFHLSYLFISHDISVVRHLADRVIVMYLGRIVEEGPVDILWGGARHPYTQTLLAAIPGHARGRFFVGR